MPAVLTERTFFDPHVPVAWEPVLVDLQAFVALENEIRKGATKAPAPAQQERLEELHERLIERSADLLEPHALDDLSSRDVNRIFGRAVLFLTRLAECVTTVAPAIDTAGSAALSLYEADFYLSPENRTALHERLVDTFGLDAAEFEELEDEVKWATGDARRKQAVARALRTEFGLEVNAPDLDARVVALFQSLFPGVDLHREEVRLILTGTLVFFCVPFRGEELTTERFASLTDEQRAPIEEFLRDVGNFKQERFAHFPAFGFLRRDRLAPDLMARLADHAELAPLEVAHELCRMVTILPLAEVDKYVVHDVWGHSWQASMLRFSQTYEELSRYAQPFDLDVRTSGPDGRSIRLGECFRRSGASLRLDEAQFSRFVQGVMAERLPVALSAVLAEAMADVAEFKLLAQDWTDEEAFQSSSYFKTYPSKLDLTLQDVRFYFLQATKVFRWWALRRKRREATCDGLVERGASRESAEAAVARAVEVWGALERGALRPEIWWEREGDELRTNVFTRAALNFLGIHRAVLETHRRLAVERPANLPLKSYLDLLVLGVSVFFEADRSRNMWRVDEFLSLHLVDLCRRLDRAG
jgi:hypothetical protein